MKAPWQTDPAAWSLLCKASQTGDAAARGEIEDWYRSDDGLEWVGQNVTKPLRGAAGAARS
jgi:hypothetical protein